MGVEELNNLLDRDNIVSSLQTLAAMFPERVVFSSSLGYEDQVITDLICRHGVGISIFTLDTGRLFEETHNVLQRTNRRYDAQIETFFPATSSVEQLVSSKGPYSFYESVENRKECCFIRKVEPLNRALAGAKVWVTGIRAQQSQSRQAVPQLEWDEAKQLFKFHPLIDWSIEQVRAYIDANNVPFNSLHNSGFVSVGCAPCTRAVKAGEDFRAGRWWWEDESKKECGLHERG